jgi:flagellar biosynthesis/type III secretory pathway protein FliH
MATIIRKGDEREATCGPAVHAVAFSFADMRGRANDYLEIVRAEAAKIVQQAHQEAEQIRRQADAAGRKAAEAAVDRMLEEKIAKRMDTLLPALERTAAQLDDAKGELLRQWEAAAIRVATTIAQRIVRRELAHEPTIALDIIAETLRLAAGAGEISVYVNASDYEHLGKQIDRLAGTICHVAPAQIVPDPEITPGGCRVTTKFGSIDQQIETQLRRIEEDLQ